MVGLARSATPLILAVEAADELRLARGAVRADLLRHRDPSLPPTCSRRAETSIHDKGAITAALYTMSEAVAAPPPKRPSPAPM